MPNSPQCSYGLDHVKIWLRSHRRASDTQIPTASKAHSEIGRSSVEILLGECSVYLNCLVQSSFVFGVGTAFPAPLCLALHPCTVYIRILYHHPEPDLDGGGPGAQAWWQAPCADTNV